MSERATASAPHHCPTCGGTEFRTGIHTERVRAPGGVFAEFGYESHTCVKCGEQLLTSMQARARELARASALRKVQGLVSPQRIKAIRAAYSLTQTMLEQILGVGAKTVVRWERGSVPQSRPVNKLLNIAERFPVVFASIAADEGINVSLPERQQGAGWSIGGGVYLSPQATHPTFFTGAFVATRLATDYTRWLAGGAGVGLGGSMTNLISDVIVSAPASPADRESKQWALPTAKVA